MNRRRIAKNSLWMTGGQILGRALGFFYYVFLARYLGVSDFGVWNWVLGLGYNFYPLADFGIQRYVLKNLAREPEKRNRYLSRLLPLRLGLAFASIFLSSIFALIFGSPQKAFYMAIFGLALFPYNLIFLYTSIKNAFEKMHFFGLATIGCSLGYTLTGILMINYGLGLGWLFLSYFIGTLLVFLIFQTLPKINFFTNWEWDPKFYKKVLSESWAFAFLQVIGVFYLRISLILIGIVGSDYQAGIYGSASKFIEAGILFPQSIAIAFFPSFSRIFVNSREKLKKTYLKVLSLVAVGSLPFAATMWAGAEYIIPVIYGPEYIEAVPVFKLMGLLLVLFFVNSQADIIIQNSEQVVGFLPYRLANFIFALFFGLILIPRMGAIGGVWTLIFSEIFGLIINNIFVFKILHQKRQN